MKKLIFFAIAGGVGFAADAGVLALLLYATSLDPYSSRIIAIACAMFCTWLINRNFTFEKGQRSVASEGFRYGSVGLSSALLNYGIYVGALFVIPRDLFEIADLRPLVALVFASALATCWSYFGYSKFVYAAPKEKIKKDLAPDEWAEDEWAKENPEA